MDGNGQSWGKKQGNAAKANETGNALTTKSDTAGTSKFGVAN